MAFPTTFEPAHNLTATFVEWLNDMIPAPPNSARVLFEWTDAIPDAGASPSDIWAVYLAFDPGYTVPMIFATGGANVSYYAYPASSVSSPYSFHTRTTVGSTPYPNPFTYEIQLASHSFYVSPNSFFETPDTFTLDSPDFPATDGFGPSDLAYALQIDTTKVDFTWSPGGYNAWYWSRDAQDYVSQHTLDPDIPENPILSATFFIYDNIDLADEHEVSGSSLVDYTINSVTWEGRNPTQRYWARVKSSWSEVVFDNLGVPTNTDYTEYSNVVEIPPATGTYSFRLQWYANANIKVDDTLILAIYNTGLEVDDPALEPLAVTYPGLEFELITTIVSPRVFWGNEHRVSIYKTTIPLDFNVNNSDPIGNFYFEDGVSQNTSVGSVAVKDLTGPTAITTNADSTQHVSVGRATNIDESAINIIASFDIPGSIDSQSSDSVRVSDSFSYTSPHFSWQDGKHDSPVWELSGDYDWLAAQLIFLRTGDIKSHIGDDVSSIIEVQTGGRTITIDAEDADALTTQDYESWWGVYNGHSIWLKWKPQAGSCTIDTSESERDAGVAVFTPVDPAADFSFYDTPGLDFVDGNSPSVTFTADGDTEYLIQVGDSIETSGSLVVKLSTA